MVQVFRETGCMNKKITLDHGSGYGKTSELIESLFLKYFTGKKLSEQGDSALLAIPSENIAFTTDSFVIKPLFFPGGNIGKLAVCGTVNDLSVSGAVPKYISCGFILEEGLSIEELQKIIISMSETAKACGIQIVTGDTKVVERGACDKLFINTTGIGFIKKEVIHISNAERVIPGDSIIVNGPIADHGLAVLSFRNSFANSIVSDCTPLNELIQSCIKTGANIHFMRDATRGGIASVLSELANKTSLGVELYEKDIPIRDETAGLCEILGFDPLYVANEGKVIMVVSKEDSSRVLAALRTTPEGRNSKVIGFITEKHPERIVLNTSIGGRRIVDIPEGTQLPRIC